MTIEDNLLRFEGLDPAKVNAILANLKHLLSAAQSQIDHVNDVLKQVATISAVVQGELPRAKQLVADIQSQIGAYEAKQKEIRW